MKFKISLVFVVCLAVQLLQPVDSARILGIFHTPSRSHLIIHESLMRELASRGHDVTVVTGLKQMGKPIPNYRYIEVPLPEDVNFKKAQNLMLKGAAKGEHFLKHFSTLMTATTGGTSQVLKSPTMEKLKKEKFDLVVFGMFVNDFQIGLAEHFNCPSVIITVMPAASLTRSYVGNPDELSSVPQIFVAANDRMTFSQRFLSVIFTGIEMAFTFGLEQFLMEPLYKEHFPEAKLSYWEAKKNVSLVLVNQHFTQSTPQALVPALQEFSGMHIKRKPDPLPENIQQWLDSATDGAILFSMGSNTKSSDLALDKRQAILRTFATLKEKVLWKFEDDNLPDKPKNVMISKWLPQDDVLAHPNIKLFISHCGKGGLSEAKYHGVPVLGIPILADQPSNLKIIEKEGWAVGLQYADLNEKTFSEAIHEALSNPNYRNVVRSHSLKFRDRPQHPLDNAVFWVEYVLRHHGAKHMQSPGVHLNFFQFYSLDVFATLLAIFYIFVKVSKWFLKFLYQKLCGRSAGNLKSKSKNSRDKKIQ